MQIILLLGLGWLCGMLVNYLADFLPVYHKPVLPVCAACNTSQPLANYLIWPRRCSNCGHRRSGRTWLIEAIYPAIACWVWISPPPGITPGLGLLLWIYFGVVVVIDIEHRLILHQVSLAGAILGLIVGISQVGVYKTLIGGLFGFSFMLALFLVGFLFIRWLPGRRSTSAGESAMGFGDVMLGGVVGLLSGWPGVVSVMLVSIFAAGAVSLVVLLFLLLLHRYRLGTAIPYGPFLVIGAIFHLYLPGV